MQNVFYKRHLIAIQVYSLHFYVISKNLVANYASIAKLKMMFQKIKYQRKFTGCEQRSNQRLGTCAM